ncbi:putative transcription factor C2H2 family [Helianthus anomalus]
MPKDRRSSSGRCRASPYSCDDKNDDRKKPKSHSLQIENKSECEEARCPICKEHPHNAVLLLCSSFDKGCRPYMCDTGPQLSNCLYQFHKSNENKLREQAKLACPLCRGEINGWTVVDPARQFMDSKTRYCSVGTCDFVGNYSQLTEHASRVHPGVRPTDVDPNRELEWRSLEEDMARQDLLSMQFEADDSDDAADLATSIGFGMTGIACQRFLLQMNQTVIRESSRSRENARTTRRRTPTHVRQRSNSQPSSHNRQE